MNSFTVFAIFLLLTVVMLFGYYVIGLSEIQNYAVIEDWLEFPDMIPHIRKTLKDGKITKHEFRKLWNQRRKRLNSSENLRRKNAIMKALFR